MSLSLRALLTTLAIQSYVSLAVVAVPVLAPMIAPDVGAPTAALGLYVTALYAASMMASLVAAQLVARIGPVRVCQLGVGFTVLACVAMSGPLPALVLSAVLVGAGYGPGTPASSQILLRTTPPKRLALTFSIKQTGVPLGAAIAGIVLPALALATGWRGSVLAIAGLGILVVLASQPIRRHLDTDLRRDRPITLGGLFAPIAKAAANRELRELARTGFCYSMSQICLVSFLVSYLTAEAGLSLVVAGLALSVLNGAAVLGRVLWGSVADRTGAPRRVLAGLGIAGGLCALLMATSVAGWPLAAVFALCTVYGAAAIGWNGVQLSEVARAAPPGEAATATAAVVFVTFSGVLIGPPLFGLVGATLGTYRPAFAAIGVVSLAAGMALAWRHRPGGGVAHARPDQK